ncbi:MAG: hypothetical protein M3Z41_02075 [Candidatus Eremiobacteraeota bacterium]|nr:hypothetical protein [Candidatus Eremiobacteraeota bacterium]
MRHLLLLVATITAVSLAACSKNTVPAGSQPTSAATALPQNTTGFPLYEGATIVAAKEFSQTISAGQGATGVMSSGAGKYSGNEIIAGSSASLSELENWLRAQEKQPPSGYVTVALPSNMETIHSAAVKNGVDFAIFRDVKNSKRGLVVVAMDLQTAHRKLGPALVLVARYQALPAAMRQTIDTQLKQRYGYTASEFVEPGSPLGTAVGAMNEFQNKNERAIVILDATKQT